MPGGGNLRCTKLIKHKNAIPERQWPNALSDATTKSSGRINSLSTTENADHTWNQFATDSDVK